MAIAILKPATAANILGPGTGSLVQPAAGSTTHIIAVKVLEMDPDFFSPGFDTTGGTDTTPQFENNALIYGTISIRGWVFAATAGILFRLTHMDSQHPGSGATGPAAPYTLSIGLGSGVNMPNPTGTFSVFLERVRFSVRKNAEGVGVAIVTRLSEWTPLDLRYDAIPG